MTVGMPAMLTITVCLSLPLSTTVNASPLPVDRVHPSLRTIAGDAPLPALPGNQHHWSAQEWEPERFKATLDNLGGVYVGTGGDQNYLYAAWARAELVVLIDPDPWIRDAHRLMKLLLQQAPTLQHFEQAWRQNKGSRIRTWIQEAEQNDKARQDLGRVWRIMGPQFRHRMARLSTSLRTKKISSFLTNQEDYAHMRSLAMRQRILFVQGHMNGKRSLNALGEALKAQALHLSVLYLSNVEEFLYYVPPFNENILGLPEHANTIVLRSLSRFEDTKSTRRYVTQHLRNFKRWLNSGQVRRVRDMLTITEASDDAVRHITGLPKAR